MLLMDGCFRVGPWGPSVYEDIISLSRVKAKCLYCLSEFLNAGKKTLFFCCIVISDLSFLLCLQMWRCSRHLKTKKLFSSVLFLSGQVKLTLPLAWGRFLCSCVKVHHVLQVSDELGLVGCHKHLSTLSTFSELGIFPLLSASVKMLVCCDLVVFSKRTTLSWLDVRYIFGAR